jgi:putative two-component system response regulator
MINILIADDNDSNIYVLEMLIDEWFEDNEILDYKLDSALNGKEAIKKVETTNYDLIFLDIMMPVMDGFEALKIIRESNLEQQPKIVVASAIVDDSINKNMAKELKANAFIVKPLSSEIVEMMLDKYVKKEDKSSLKNRIDNKKYIYFDN